MQLELKSYVVITVGSYVRIMFTKIMLELRQEVTLDLLQETNQNHSKQVYAFLPAVR